MLNINLLWSMYYIILLILPYIYIYIVLHYIVDTTIYIYTCNISVHWLSYYALWNAMNRFFDYHMLVFYVQQVAVRFVCCLLVFKCLLVYIMKIKIDVWHIGNLNWHWTSSISPARQFLIIELWCNMFSLVEALNIRGQRLFKDF